MCYILKTAISDKQLDRYLSNQWSNSVVIFAKGVKFKSLLRNFWPSELKTILTCVQSLHTKLLLHKIWDLVMYWVTRVQGEELSLPCTCTLYREVEGQFSKFRSPSDRQIILSYKVKILIETTNSIHFLQNNLSFILRYNSSSSFFFPWLHSPV
jgi:hypothetical protein